MKSDENKQYIALPQFTLQPSTHQLFVYVWNSLACETEKSSPKDYLWGESQTVILKMGCLDKQVHSFLNQVDFIY